MKKIQLYSTALSVGCAVGVLMAVMITGNKSNLPRTAVVVPTKSPTLNRGHQNSTLSNRLIQRRELASNPQNIDTMTTSSISNSAARTRKRGIGDLISAEEINPFPGEGNTHTVSAGDTLFGIARQRGINALRLAKINGLDAPYVIRPGQILHLESSQ